MTSVAEDHKHIEAIAQDRGPAPVLAGYETPRLVLDRSRLERNLARMHDQARKLGVKLRPHLKTAKSVDVARLAVDGTERITVSTLREADYFAAAGFRDILYAVGMAPNKVAHAASLTRRGVDLCIVLDSLEAVRLIAPAAAAEGVTLPVMIEIDTDGERAGVKPTDLMLVEIAKAVAASEGLTLRGVMTHAGASYDCADLEEVAETAEAERRGAVEAAASICAVGIPVDEVSVGSTPTALFARKLDGVTEVRAGVYVFFDLVMAGLGVCSLDDIALSVLATVIGHQPDKGLVLIDAGWMALSSDRGTAEQTIDQKFGVVCLENGEILPDVLVVSTNQEHGALAARHGARPLDITRFPVGSRVRILPNHACATSAHHESYLVVGRDGVSVEAEWPRLNGW